eukprot:s340_g6.t1
MGGQCSSSCSQNEKKQEDLEDGIDSVASTQVGAHEILEFLNKVQLFKRLPENVLPSLAPVCEVKDYLPGDVVIEQGDDGHELFVIRWGITSVQVNGQEVAQLKEGDYFGENALLRDEPRTATIQAKAPLSTIIVRRSKFEELGLREKLHFKVRKAIGGGFLETAAAKPPCSKTPAEREVMERALKNNSNLQGLVALDDKSIQQLIDCAWEEQVPAGYNVISEGDINASFFYIIKNGKFDVMQKSSEAGKEALERVGQLKVGNSFGELALIYTAPRAATVKAVIDSELWVMDRSDFKKILADKNDKAKEYVVYLDKVDLLRESLKAEEKQALAQSLTEMSFTDGELIFEQGEAGDSFYILIDGQVSVIKDGVEQTRLTATASSAQHFGERALLNNSPRAATIKVTSEVAKTLRLDRETFEWLLGSLEELQKMGNDRPVVVMNPSTKLIRNASLMRSASHLGTTGGDRECDSIGPIERLELCMSTMSVVGLCELPVSCGSWPAFWMFGEDEDNVWPEWGEFDIMEWIHEEESVSTTLHTKANCTQKHLYPGWHMKARWNKGKWPSVDASDCFVHADGQWTNQGCSQRGMHGSIGEGFNAAGGGTYAAEWDPIAGHMRVWIWQAGQEPEDVINKTPNPELWGQPEFYFSLKDDCHPDHFKNMKLVFDITFCGDLGEPTFRDHCGRKGFGERKQRTYTSCVDMVRKEFSAFDETYWSVQGLDVYRRADAGSLAGLLEGRATEKDSVDERQCRSEHTNQLQKRIKDSAVNESALEPKMHTELESILFMKEAELKELYALLHQAETPDSPPGHGRRGAFISGFLSVQNLSFWSGCAPDAPLLSRGKHLKPIGLLGCGGFGSVELVEHEHTGETYALKAMSKGFIIQCGMKQSVLTEKAVQMMCNSLFIIRLYETYNGEQTLYFLLEAALGGELYATYNKKGFFGKA